MNNRKGFTLVEITAALVIIGILAAITVPHYTAYTQQGAARAALNNLITIYGAQNNYYTGTSGNGAYCIAGCDTLSDINTNLFLNLVDPNFQYTCSTTATQNPNRSTGFTCTATDSYFTLTLTDAHLVPYANPKCVPAGSTTCPG